MLEDETRDLKENKENYPPKWEFVPPPTKQENRDLFISAKLEEISRTLKLGIYVLIILLLIILWKVW